ncbi:Eukaryotic translation initiation factor 3 subunit J [Geodia barretti]|uniref:Eukaryotic translation initiation factor 3 subunit J n=1 Tax=Geodia barretti TaxID=519541 RepID=A0AA35QXK4_GEOBA|nr:Eukaryotic translation initiation factor 3 subunit J [Geodia barretti]
MSDGEDAWDADDFNPEAGFVKPSEEGGDVWEGEDEGLVIEDDKQDPKLKPVAVAKKSKAERIEEKKAKRRDEEQKGKVATESKEPESVSAEEQLEEKRKVEEAQREADLESAKELFGVSVAGSGDHLERMNPKTPEEFEEFRSALSKKITEFEASTHYTTFLEGLFRSVCTPLDVEDLRRLSSAIGAMATEKQKLKQPHTKKKKGGKVVLGSVGKGSKRVDMNYDDDLGADFDDFM